MIIANGDKVHLIYRALYENAIRRHFVGEVAATDGALCRIVGHAYIYDEQEGTYTRRPERRTTIANVAESGYIVNIIGADVDLDKVSYRYIGEVGLVVTDGKDFTLNINEFGPKS